MRGKDMIFISDQTAGEFTATIKRLIRWTERDWHVRQLANPPTGQKAEFTLSRKTWPRALRVVGKYYGGRRGPQRQAELINRIGHHSPMSALPRKRPIADICR